LRGAQDLRESLLSGQGQKAKRDIVMHAYGEHEPVVLVKKGAVIQEGAVNEMETALELLLDDINAELDNERAAVVSPQEEAKLKEQEELNGRLAELRVDVQDQIDALHSETERRVERIQALHERQAIDRARVS